MRVQHSTPDMYNSDLSHLERYLFRALSYGWLEGKPSPPPRPSKYLGPGEAQKLKTGCVVRQEGKRSKRFDDEQWARLRAAAPPAAARPLHLAPGTH
ncbi:hypothetical protein VTI28DRAFT_2200 [Corynascus sepedonium]